MGMLRTALGVSLLAFACDGRANNGGPISTAGFAGAIGGAAGELAGAPSTHGDGGTTALGDAGSAGANGQTQPACDGGVCAAKVVELVRPAANCQALRLVYDAGRIYWLDVGHGSVHSVSSAGGAVTTLASGRHIAVLQGNYGPLLSAAHQPLPTSPLVRGGTVYWIGASDPMSVDAMGVGHGGVGTTLLSATAGGAPKTLLPSALDPGPSPVSSVGALQLEHPGVNPPLNAIALSPDGGTLYFAAGTRFYSIPSTGAVSSADVTYLGYTQGFPDEPEGGLPAALTANGRYLFYLALLGDNVQALDLSAPCAANSTVSCGILLTYGFPTAALLPDTIFAQDDALYWASGSQLQRFDLAHVNTAPHPALGLQDTLQYGAISAFALGPSFAYFAEVGDGASVLEKSSALPTGTAPVFALATVNAIVTSLALDDQKLYWTTSDCEIQSLVDARQ